MECVATGLNDVRQPFVFPFSFSVIFWGGPGYVCAGDSGSTPATRRRNKIWKKEKAKNQQNISLAQWVMRLGGWKTMPRSRSLPSEFCIPDIDKRMKSDEEGDAEMEQAGAAPSWSSFDVLLIRTRLWIEMKVVKASCRNGKQNKKKKVNGFLSFSYTERERERETDVDL